MVAITRTQRNKSRNAIEYLSFKSQWSDSLLSSHGGDEMALIM